ncbi:PIG-X [Geopyxis carbonaria]|nr:PIG-X [Geopyxis carbonaria]
MKQRTTFLVANSDAEATHPDNFILSPSSFQIKNLPAAREDRLTLAFDELPVEIWDVLKQCKELHIRWASGKLYVSSDPYGSRVPAGLHVFVTPQSEVIPPICTLLNAAFSISECSSFEKSFVGIPGTHQFYHPLSHISSFRSYLEKLLCSVNTEKCKTRLGRLETADYVDLKYDAVSQTFVASAFWSRPKEPWRGTLKSLENDPKIEVGVLGHEKPMAEESFTLSGFLHVVGTDDKLEPVVFTFPSRHHSYQSSYSLTTQKPTGLHPKLKLSMTQPLKAPNDDCTLNAYFTLPRALFIDKYQLASSNPQLLQSLNIKRLRDVSGETDLEAPAWASEKWGSSVLVEIDTASSNGEILLNVELPLHLRYLEPSHNTTSTEVRFASPSVFWACRSGDWSQMGNNPFDRARLGWEHLFPEQTMFYHLSPSDDAWNFINAPILNLQYTEIVKSGTVVVIIGGFLWIIWKLLAAIQGRNTAGEKKSQ